MPGIEEYLRSAVERDVSDLFIVSGIPVSAKREGVILPEDEQRVMPERANELVSALYAMAKRPMDKFIDVGDDDFSISIPGLSRFRVSTYRQRGSMAAVIRVVNFEIPEYRKMNIPEGVMNIAQKTRGLILVTGPAGGGKSTTLACIIDAINSTRTAHVITLEDPIEYLHRNKKSIVSQREVGTDTESYYTALRASLRQAPNVILLGEMRDFETIRIAMTAAETGHLVISTLHTTGAVSSIDRIIDTFPANQQQQIRVQLSMVLQSVVSQQLIPAKDGSLVPAFEIMHLNSSVRNLIRESKIHQIDFVIQSSAAEGMTGMDTSIENLYRRGIITRDTAVKYAVNPEQMERKL